MKIISLTIVVFLSACSVAVVDPGRDEAGAAPRSELPELSLDNIAGEPLSIESWPGKPLLVNFWGTWCEPCLREIPLLKEFQRRHPSVQVVGIAVDNVDAVRDFDVEMRFNYPIMVAGEQASDAAAAFGIRPLAVPFTVLTASDGGVLGVHTGEISDEQLLAFAEALNDLGVGRVGIETARARLAEAGFGIHQLGG